MPEASPGLKKIAANRLQWLDGQMADGKEYLCGKRFTLADILLYCWLDFGARSASRSIPPTPISRRGSRASAQRPSVKA